MSSIAPLKTIAVGIVVERSKSAGPWIDFLWRPIAALGGAPDTPPWTKLSDEGERATFFVGAADIELYRSEAGNYRQNLLVEMPLLWVALRRTDTDPPYVLAAVTVDPAEGESWAALGNDLVDTVAMPAAVEAPLPPAKRWKIGYRCPRKTASAAPAVASDASPQLTPR